MDPPLAEDPEPPRPASSHSPSRSGLKLKIPLGFLVVVALAAAAFWSLRLGYADWLFHSGSPEARNRAARLAPGNAGYLPESDDSLESTVRLNPFDSSAWIRLGLQAEMRRDFQAAEKHLLRAADVDKTYEPRWSLANFYFRRERPDEFWLWAQRAAEMAYQDQSALFDLCWRVSQNPETILDRAIPDRTQILAQYLRYLLGRNMLDAAGGAAGRLIPRAGPAERDLLLGYCDRLLRSGWTLAAVESWNRLSSRALIPYTALDPPSGRSLTNGDLAVRPLQAAFDWRVTPPEGVSATVAVPDGLRLSFSGGQPESCRLVEQTLPLAPAKKYRLSCNYRTSGIVPGSGLRWVVADASNRQLGTSTDLAADSWREAQFLFSTPSGCDRANLTLVYQRAPGTTRIEGSLWLRRVTLRFAESGGLKSAAAR